MEATAEQIELVDEQLKEWRETMKTIRANDNLTRKIHLGFSHSERLEAENRMIVMPQAGGGEARTQIFG